MRSLLVVAGIVATALAEQRDFAPQDPEGTKHNPSRVWLHLSPKCFPEETDVRDFKDHLVKNYECIHFNEPKHQRIWKHPASANYSVWSIFLDRAHNAVDMSCLTTTIDLPNNYAAECVEKVMYEPMQFTTDYDSCGVIGAKELSNVDLWSLDYLDGTYDDLYQYPVFSSAVDASVVSIVLDTLVDTTHVEFSGLSITDLSTEAGLPVNPSAEYNHGTHVAGTVVGHNVGGSTNTPLAYFPVCQNGGGCSWLDIANGYNLAIEYMNANPNKRFVINYSVGGDRTSDTDAQYNAWGAAIQSAGGIWVTSAGNSATDTCNGSPAFSTQNIAVGAYDVSRAAAWFSNYGPTCTDVWGPGVSVWSAGVGAGYVAMSGTSMASPSIAGIVVNMLKDDSSLTLANIKSLLSTNANFVNNGGNAGRMNQAYFKPTC